MPNHLPLPQIPSGRTPFHSPVVQCNLFKTSCGICCLAFCCRWLWWIWRCWWCRRWWWWCVSCTIARDNVSPVSSASPFFSACFNVFGLVLPPNIREQPKACTLRESAVKKVRKRILKSYAFRKHIIVEYYLRANKFEASNIIDYAVPSLLFQILTYDTHISYLMRFFSQCIFQCCWRRRWPLL